ncbi:MAG: methyltransferase [Vicingaceae bacterium]
MSELTYNSLIWLEFILAIIVFIALFFTPAPYGKHHRNGWGPALRVAPAWILMELPAVVIPGYWFFTNLHLQTSVSTIFLIIWMSHYLYRTFIYPFTISRSARPFPLIIVLFGLLFNCLNGTVNGYYLFDTHIKSDDTWLTSWPFITGCALFLIGMVVNKQSEFILAQLKKQGNDYQIPKGGLFRYVSNPHYLGEIIEWCGWAVLTWSICGLAFFVFTVANLFPRAITVHKWYKNRFEEYPNERTSIIPWLI